MKNYNRVAVNLTKAKGPNQKLTNDLFVCLTFLTPIFSDVFANFRDLKRKLN